jgi:hypothetical protein
MAGTSAAEIQPLMAKLTSTEQSTLLCLVCFMVDQMDTTCLERVAEMKRVLANNCEFFTGCVACYESCREKVALESATPALS